MRLPPVAPAVTRTVSIVLAAAAAGVLAVTALTALADRPEGRPRAAAEPSSSSSLPASPVVETTMPGSIDLPSTSAPATPKVRAADAKTWLKALAGKWTQDAEHNYFLFESDGTGEWVAFGQKLWTGKATPRNATTFDLSDSNGQGASYWRVQLVDGGKKLFFAGTQKTYRKG